MGAKERRAQPTSQATPLSGDVLGIFQKAMGAGGFQPVSPLQRQAQNALSNFLTSKEPFDLGPLLSQLEALQTRTTGGAAADLREGFGISGSRFGTPLAIGEAGLRSDLGGQFGAQTAKLLQDQFNIGNEQMLQAIGLGGQLSQQNIMPFVQLASLGILPEQIFFEQNPLVTGINAAANLAQGVGALRGS